ncbi:MAG: type III-A CRISPR-associated RAMP protein Csm3 [Armatimonadetes bacterium]|nr:type III-A CRISPR-associated RAMP protein Csm3 [Armatimonadota bacterium]
MASWMLKGRLVMQGYIRCVTGLHIGGSQGEVDIGGLDSPVVRVEWLPYWALPKQGSASEGVQPPGKARVPYIPGSSLRGKMRSLLEWYEGKITTGGPTGAHECPSPQEAVSCPICRVFGIAAKEEERQEEAEHEAGSWQDKGPTRLRIEDAYPTLETLEELARYYDEAIYTEIKWENYLDRLTSMANPRQIERVPAGAVFFMRMTYDVLQPPDGQTLHPDDLEMFPGSVLTALRLLEDSALGGHGSRGYGRIELADLELIWRPREYYAGQAEQQTLAQAARLEEFANSVTEGIKNIDGSAREGG